MRSFITSMLQPFRQWPIRTLWRCVLLAARADPVALFIVTLVNILFGAGATILLWLGKIVIDEVTRLIRMPGSLDFWSVLYSQPELLLAVAGFVMLTIGLDAAETIGVFYFSTLRDRMEEAIKKSIYQAISAFDDIALFETPDLLNIKQMAEQSIPRGRLFVNVLTNLFTGVAVVVPVLALSFSISWWVPVVIFFSAVPLVYTQMYYENRTWSVEQAQAGIVRQMRACEQVLTGETYAKEMRLYRLQTFFLQRWSRLFEKAFHEMQQVRLQGVRSILIWSLFSGLGAAIPYMYVIAVALRGGYTLGDLALYAGLVFQARRSLKIFVGNTGNLHDVLLGADAIFRLLDLQPTMGGDSEQRLPVPFISGHGCLSMDNVSFTYPGSTTEVLHDINLSIHPGEVVVIVGENGAGKTTLVKLLCRLYDPQSGLITWDGKDIRSLDLETLRQRIAVVMQDYACFPSTVRENIGLGLLERLSDEISVRAAANAAGLTLMIDHLPNKLDTPLSKQLEQGVDLSGGQWQRIAMARALMRHPQAQLLLLDEPTAALDPHIEHEMIELLRSMTEGKMSVIISHRLALARMADKIVVISQGRIAENGSHEELMAQRGLYYDMFTRQASRYIDPPVSAPEEGV
jgi:ATP-binding cassette subfamily B protein